MSSSEYNLFPKVSCSVATKARRLEKFVAEMKMSHEKKETANKCAICRGTTAEAHEESFPFFASHFLES